MHTVVFNGGRSTLLPPVPSVRKTPFTKTASIYRTSKRSVPAPVRLLSIPGIIQTQNRPSTFSPLSLLPHRIPDNPAPLQMPRPAHRPSRLQPLGSPKTGDPIHRLPALIRRPPPSTGPFLTLPRASVGRGVTPDSTILDRPR